MSTPKVYLAGPEVFARDPLSAAAEKKRLCRKFGLEGRFPLDASLRLDGLSKERKGLAISEANENLIRSCDAVLANMTPFRSPSADVGTAFEMGFARALGMPIVGYSCSPLPYRERVIALVGKESVQRRATGEIEDGEHMVIEDFDMIDNLMLDGAAIQSGGLVLCRATDESVAGLMERAVRALAELLLNEPTKH